VVRRFLRTPSFLARYFDLDLADHAKAFVAAIERQDVGGLSLRRRVEDFCSFLANRCIVIERQQYLDAIAKIQSGSHAGREAIETFDSSEQTEDARRKMLLPNVRLANGRVKDETRRRLLLAFNTPLFPEILIASSVLAEGVDLHLNCRYVIHHDLCWNPSTLEQRTGRIDRLGSKSEQVGKSIHVYLPYVAATQDEKMYKVVRDRERWFQIVMGDRYEVDEASSDRRAERIPLPRAIQDALVLKLEA
jgi:superfamily II DNA/RNA helicase